jgi:hypothetical protein
MDGLRNVWFRPRDQKGVAPDRRDTCIPQRSVTPPARASRLDERRDRDPREDDSGRRRNEPVHGVGDDHGPSPLRKGPLTATVGNAMLLISMYVRRILTVSRESASQTTTAR